MKKLLLVLLVPATVYAGCCWRLVSSNYDFAIQKWVCVYESTQGTRVREFQTGMCSLTPQYH